MMIPVLFAFLDVIDDDGFRGAAHLVAQGRGHVESVADLQAEIELVPDRARRPRRGRHVRDRDETQASERCDSLQNFWHGTDGLDLAHIRHHLCTHS
jgi:hypothetical protein